MDKSEKLPKEIYDRFRRILAKSGVKPQVMDEDSVKTLNMLLYAIEREIDYRSPYTTLWGLVQEYCSPDGLDRFSHHLRDKPKQVA